MEVAEQAGPPSHFQGDDGSDTEAEQGEPVVEPRENRRYAEAVGLRHCDVANGQIDPSLAVLYGVAAGRV